MDTKELLEIYKALFETWRFQVNSHWQRSAFFSALETVALAACWKLLTGGTEMCSAFFGLLLALLGISITFVWLLINERTHKYVLFWLDSVGKVETKLMKCSGEGGIDFANQILDSKRSTIKQSWISHHLLERTVPCLFIVAWIALFLFGIKHLLIAGCLDMHGAVSYKSVAIAIAIASLLTSGVAAFIARSALSQAKRVADRDQNDWKQRKWFDLYFKADEAYDALDRFQTLYPSTSSPGWNTAEMLREWSDLMRAMRTVHRIALVFPQDPEVSALLGATAAFKDTGEAASKDRLSKVFDAVEGIRQKALIGTSVLD